MLHGADRERSQSGLSSREGNCHVTSDPSSWRGELARADHTESHEGGRAPEAPGAFANSPSGNWTRATTTSGRVRSAAESTRSI